VPSSVRADRTWTARALARLDRRILRAYSARTTETLRGIVPLRVALPHLERFLARNVAKEIEKDDRVIRRAAEAPGVPGAPGRDVLEGLFAATQQIDREFLSAAGGFPVGIVLRYDQIAPIRLRRIERLFEASTRILEARREQTSLRSALRSCYAQADVERLVREILWLYSQEVLVLSRSVRLPALIGPIREMVAQRLVQVMNEAAAHLAARAARAVYRAGHGPHERGV
jgi:hypothetical protein